MHFEADLANEINRVQSAGKINDAKMHFNLASFPSGMPTTSHSIVLMLLWQFWSKPLKARPGLHTHRSWHTPRFGAKTEKPGQPVCARSKDFLFCNQPQASVSKPPWASVTQLASNMIL